MRAEEVVALIERHPEGDHIQADRRDHRPSKCEFGALEAFSLRQDLPSRARRTGSQGRAGILASEGAKPMTRRRLTSAQKARIFDAAHGLCHICNLKIPRRRRRALGGRARQASLARRRGRSFEHAAGPHPLPPREDGHGGWHQIARRSPAREIPRDQAGISEPANARDFPIRHQASHKRSAADLARQWQADLPEMSSKPDPHGYAPRGLCREDAARWISAVGIVATSRSATQCRCGSRQAPSVKTERSRSMA